MREAIAAQNNTIPVDCNIVMDPSKVYMQVGQFGKAAPCNTGLSSTKAPKKEKADSKEEVKPKLKKANGTQKKSSPPKESSSSDSEAED
jgi:hypothetical protein